MPRIAYVNGGFVPHSLASVHVEDRGYQFADAVYEVIPVVGGKLIDAAPHWDRLERSLTELDIPMPRGRRGLDLICAELLRQNRVVNGAVYMQVSRGVAKRDHLYAAQMTPALVITAKSAKFRVDTSVGIKVRTVPDIRWGRVDIKTVGLLPNSMAKTQAVQDGYGDAWMVDADGMVTEGTSNNAWIVLPGNGDSKRLVTRRATNSILNGVTRLRVLDLAQQNNWVFEERAFSVEEAIGAEEAFITSATAFVKPVVQIDDAKIGNGTPGPVTQAVGAAYQSFVDAGL